MATDVNFGLQHYFGFDPRTIPGCSLWLDAADRTSFVLSGTSVTTWNDKSGNGRNAENQATAGVLVDNVQNQLSVVRLAGVNNYAIPYASFPNTAYTVFTLQYLASSSGGYARFLQNDNNPAGSPPGLFIGVGPDGTSVATFTGPGGGWNDVDTNSPAITNLTTWRIVTTWVSGSTLTPYVDGTAQTNKVGTTRAFSNLNLGSYPGSPLSQPWNGDAGEIIIYSSALPTAQRQTVEGYLAWKWGLQTSLPSPHPYRYGPLVMRVFQPSDILNCAVWVDPADRSSILALSGTQPTSIRSKGHQDITLDNLTPQVNPGGPGGVWTGWPPTGATNYGTQFMTNSSSNLNTLQFTRTVGSGGVYGNGYNGSYLRIPSVTFSNQQRTLFYVHSAQSTGLDSYAHIFAPTNWSGLRHRGFHDYGQTAYIMFPLSDGGSTQALVAGGVAPYSGVQPTDGTPYIFGLRHTTSTATSYTSVNGTPQVPPLANLALTTGYTTETNEYVIGIFFAYTRQFLMGDFILYDGAIQDAEIYQLEGYLAWKWGLRNSLPTTHPFYTFPPATPLFVPPLLDNCALWFDAADRSTITGSSPVTAWVNKGSISTTVSTTTGTSTSGNTFNGLNYINIPAGSEMRFTAAINTQARSWFLVARATTPFTANPQFWGPVNATATGRDGLVVYSDTSIFILYNGPNGIGIPVSGYIANPYNRVGLYALVNSVTPALNVLTDNGTPVSLLLSSPAENYNTGSAEVRVGTAGYNTGSDLMEIILYYGDLAPSARRRVEGYLAWKWGLQNNLPSSHPYSKFRP